MQTIETKIQVGPDRQLKIDLPATVSMGEYEVVLVLNHRSAETSAGPDEADALARRWDKWFEEVDRLPLPENPGAGDFQQHLVEKYRQQGLEL